MLKRASNPNKINNFLGLSPHILRSLHYQPCPLLGECFSPLEIVHQMTQIFMAPTLQIIFFTGYTRFLSNPGTSQNYVANYLEMTFKTRTMLQSLNNPDLKSQVLNNQVLHNQVLNNEVLKPELFCKFSRNDPSNQFQLSKVKFSTMVTPCFRGKVLFTGSAAKKYKKSVNFKFK